MSANPVFAPILSAFQRSTSDVLVAGYITMLKKHDWTHEYGAHRQWERGQIELADLREAQKQLDPDFAIWNQHCPEHYKRKA